MLCGQAATASVAALLLALFWVGCSSTVTRRTGPSEELPPASSETRYNYRITNKNCNCLKYVVVDAAARVEYSVTASYKMQTGILTEIAFVIMNRSDDTLFFERGAIKVSSRNIRYQYNDKFLPLPWEPILPRSSGSRQLTGKEVTNKNDWHKIAGEHLTVSIKGLTLSGRELAGQVITFIPENPNIGE